MPIVIFKNNPSSFNPPSDFSCLYAMRNDGYMKSEEDLICGYLKNELTGEETSRLIDWLKQDKKNKRLFDEMSDLWVTIRAASADPDFDAREGFRKFRERIAPANNQQERKVKTVWLKTLVRYAAAIIIAFSAGGVLFWFAGRNSAAPVNQSINKLVVPLGSRAWFTLSDGTVVTLNAGSTLNVSSDYGINNRIVRLDGEGYFNIARDTSRPFVVQTSFLNVRALGTEFNVKAYSVDRTIETTLVSGSVQIEPVKEINQGKITVLKPNQKVTFYKEDSVFISGSGEKEKEALTRTESVKKIRTAAPARLVTEDVNVDPVTSWKENRWIFEQQSLAQIAVDLERKFDVQIVFDSEKLKSYRFTGTILAEPIEQVLVALSMTAPINYKVRGRVVTLSENKDFIEINRDLYLNRH